MSKHVPGPWTIGYRDGSGGIDPEDGSFCIVGPDDEPIIHAEYFDDLNTATSYARLIAAAPCMLDALEQLHSFLYREDWSEKRNNELDVLLRQVIAKAKGEA